MSTPLLTSRRKARAAAVVAIVVAGYSIALPAQAKYRAKAAVVKVGLGRMGASPIRVGLDPKLFAGKPVAIRLVTATGETTIASGYLDARGAFDACASRQIFNGQTLRITIGYKSIATKAVAPADFAGASDICGNFTLQNGADGAQGLQGVDGLNGATGATGAIGPQGPSVQVQVGSVNIVSFKDVALANITVTDLGGGVNKLDFTIPAGPPGQDGATGPAGPKGDQGVTGPSGAPGQTGATGPAGINGVTGPQGNQGPAGNNGATGPQGLTGNAGAPGLNGATGPAGPQGLKGDTGAQGAQGATGSQGPTGPKGDQGLQGLIGATGAAGAPGLNGTNGATGPTGPQGLQGPKGDTGPQGAQGPQGVTGPKGDTGAQGLQGVTGAKGDTGTTGLSGLELLNQLCTNSATGVTGKWGAVDNPTGSGANVKHNYTAVCQQQ